MIMSELFIEFAKTNQTILDLAHSTKIFKPEPFSSYNSRLMVVESVQPNLFWAWHEQLERYKKSLSL